MSFPRVGHCAPGRRRENARVADGLVVGNLHRRGNHAEPQEDFRESRELAIPGASIVCPQTRALRCTKMCQSSAKGTNMPSFH